MSENLFGLTVAADKGLDDLQCQRDCAKPKRECRADSALPFFISIL